MIGLLFVCSMIGCAADPSGTGESSTSDGDTVTTGAGENSFTASDLPSLDRKTETVIPFAQDCVFIQWCDEPPAGGTWTVVGKVRASCRNQCWNDALINEFFRDARAVCGSTSLDDNRWRIECF
jgi:hypothetical protein